MKRFLNLLIAMIAVAFFTTTTTKGQNLVPNPSFETFDTCPNSVNQISRTAAWSNFRGTTDYFNSCNGGSVGVPLNIYDYQNARTGDAYSGFAPFNTFGSSVRECLGVQLIEPLIIGQRYFVSFYINRVGNNSLNTNIAINKIGVKFSTLKYTLSNQVPIDNFAHIYTDSIISDTLNWSLISGSFVADSAYSFLSIGNFFKDSLTLSNLFDSTAKISYYFCDDVSVTLDSPEASEIIFKKAFSIYPTPTNRVIYISGYGHSYYEIKIYDVWGILNYSGSSKGQLTTVDLVNFPQGMYYVLIKYGDQIIQEKILKY